MLRKPFPQLLDLALQRRDSFFKVGTWSGRSGDKPSDAVSGLCLPTFLQLTVGAANGHHRDLMALGQGAGRGQLISRFQFTGADLLAQVVQDSEVWLLSLRHKDTVHDRVN